ncbi:MAG: sigma-54-dependent Fis family transcriptional regulator [Candidatus Cloacimonetes bacterium]|nr:sigma-54-dependent Fis family transcriptional regulator [Candidatus Cloacimonadota bacterium]
MQSILVVDDNKDLLENMVELFTENGYKTYKAEDGETALEIINKHTPDAVILDMKLPGIDGWQVLERVKQDIENGMIVIIMTAYGEVEDAVKAIKMGAYDFIEKPFDNNVMLLTVERGLSSQKTKKELYNLKRSMGALPDGEAIFGKSEAMRKVLKQIEIVAPTDMTVLIQGETGTGKEVMANFIYGKSNRNKSQFIAVDCGAIPESLIESELFGFEKGSFTGADKRKQGKFELANKGTLFLDEIGNLPIEQQRRLLRAVEQKKITPIGAKNEIEADVRLITSTNVNLAQLVQEKKFREDLYYRLNEFVIEMPPLRNRLEDIPYLGKVFVQEATFQLNSDIEIISDDAMKILVNYSWPGNVRQLKNVIRKACLIASKTILPEHISLSALSEEYSFSQNSSTDFYKNLPFRKTIEDVEKRLIEKEITKANGNISLAAKTLGISRRTIHYKIEKYKIK